MANIRNLSGNPVATMRIYNDAGNEININSGNGSADSQLYLHSENYGDHGIGFVREVKHNGCEVYHNIRNVIRFELEN